MAETTKSRRRCSPRDSIHRVKGTEVEVAERIRLHLMHSSIRVDDPAGTDTDMDGIGDDCDTDDDNDGLPDRGRIEQRGCIICDDGAPQDDTRHGDHDWAAFAGILVPSPDRLWSL